MANIHTKESPLAGQTVTIKKGRLAGEEYWVEDWWDRVSGGSWMFAQGNPAAMKYGMRSGFEGLPIDDEVLYGKIGGLGELVHISEVE